VHILRVRRPSLRQATARHALLRQRKEPRWAQRRRHCMVNSPSHAERLGAAPMQMGVAVRCS
jgi:hypothetical protein